MNKSKTTEEHARKMFKELKKHLNKEVGVIYTEYGRISTIKDKLTEVNDFTNVVVESLGIPFVGYGCGIILIESKSGQVLYFNPTLGVDYNEREEEKVDEARRKIFGDRIVDIEKRKREEYERETQEFLENAAREAKRSKLTLQKEGLALVRPETAEDWIEFTEKNCNDGYSCCIVKATLGMMKKMEEGVPFEEAEHQIFSEELGLTGFQAGAAANCIAHFAKRGDEFRKYWNAQWGVSEEEKGTVNPSILHIG